MKHLSLVFALLLLLPACESADKSDKPRISPTWSEKIDSQMADADKKVIPSQYAGLTDRTVAVFVDVPEKFTKDYPQCQREVARKTARYLSDYVEGVKVVNPDQIVDLQRGSPEWRDMSFEQLIRWINVDRIVLVDVTHIEINDPDDASEHLAVILGKIGVIEFPLDAPPEGSQSDEGAENADVAEPVATQAAGSGELAFVNSAAAFVATDEATSSADFADESTLKYHLEWRFATKVGHLFVDHY
jgi:hypothetical protein